MTLDFLYPALTLPVATVGSACAATPSPADLPRHSHSAFRLRVMKLQEALAQLMGDTNYMSVSG